MSRATDSAANGRSRTSAESAIEVATIPHLFGIEGHRESLRLLHAAASRGSLPHALLFSGPEGVGKKLVARAVAAELLSSYAGDPEEKEAGPTAEKLVLAGTHPDLHFLRTPEGKRDIPVEEIRALCANLHLKPYAGNGAVAIIDNAHTMSIASSNALLMTLEEPPANSYLILISDAPQRLPATILSRCQTVPFGLLSRNQVANVIRSLLASGGESGDQEQSVHSLTTFAEGSLASLRLEQFLDPVTGLVTDQKGLHSHLAAVHDTSSQLTTRIGKLVSAVAHRSEHFDPTLAADCAMLAADLAAMKEDIDLVWQSLFRAIRNAMRSASEGSGSLDVPRELASMLDRAVRAEKGVRERSLSLELQLSTVLIGSI